MLAGIPATEHEPYRPKPVWEHYPKYLPDNRPIYEPGWDKAGHFFNHAFLTFEFLYTDDRGYPEAGDLRGVVESLEYNSLVATWGQQDLLRFVQGLEDAHFWASLSGQPYEPSLTIFDDWFGPYTAKDVEAFFYSKVVGHVYEYLSTPYPWKDNNDVEWWTQKELGGVDRPFEWAMITQGLMDQGLWRDLTANKRGAKFGIRAYHDPFSIP